MGKLQDKLDEAKAKHKALMIRSSTAQNRLRVRETVADHKIEDALSRYASLERKVDELEAQADAFDLNQGKSLESQFADLEGQESIEKELSALKAKMNKSASKPKEKSKAKAKA
jgi:phage shock protein A